MPLPKITLGLIVLFVMLFLYINADIVYGIYAEQVKTVMVAYFLLLAVVLASFGVGLPSMSLSIYEIKNFALMFILTSLVLVPLQFLQGLSAEVAITTALGFGLFHAFVKAFIEETIWADILKKRIGIHGSAITFGLFHLAVTYTALGVNFIAIGILVILRYIWDFVHDRYGVMGSTGSHFAYNAFVMGMKLI